jgi:hypothetical protein
VKIKRSADSNKPRSGRGENIYGRKILVSEGRAENTESPAGVQFCTIRPVIVIGFRTQILSGGLSGMDVRTRRVLLLEGVYVFGM